MLSVGGCPVSLVAAASAVGGAATGFAMLAAARPSQGVFVGSAAAIHGYTVAFSVSCGLFLAGVSIILDLELRIAQLEAQNRYLVKNLGMAAATDYFGRAP